MAQAVKDSFLDLERHRQLLEENIEKLRKALQHWQTWEAEYEGLKEDILAVEPADREQLVAICRDYQGELVTPKEIQEILGVDTRTTAQVVNVLDRRIDYVGQNVRTVQKQFDAAENKLAVATIISDPDVRNEEGLPMTEILEELDEEGNVINSSLTTPGSAKPQLLEVLQKAGVALPDIDSTAQSLPIPTSPPPVEVSPTKTVKSPKPVQKPMATKKAVKFAEDTKPGPELEKSYTAKRIEAIMELAKSQSEPPTEPPVIPTDESAEDAVLRRQMLQYGLSEVGAVVAELELEEGSDWDDEGWDDDDDDSSDDEDKYGRSTGRLVDEELRAQMIELEKKLGVRMMENIGQKASDYEEVMEEGIGRIVINGKDDEAAPKSSLKSPSEVSDIDTASSKPAKKSVKFSEELDIAPTKISPMPPAPANSKVAPPVSDIVERSAPSEVSSPQPQSQKKASRFKSARASGTPKPAPKILNGPLSFPGSNSLTLQPAKPTTPKPFSQPIAFTSSATDNPRTVPTGPEDRIVAPTIIERETPAANEVTEPDDMDAQLLNQEVATEYHRMRNKFIAKQGGFMKEEDGEFVPFSEEEGGAKKMSRFKAARLGL